MKYGAGSALLSEVIARSSSCCRVRISTVSPFALERSCPRTPGAISPDKIRAKNEGLKDSIVLKSVPEALDTARVTLALAGWTKTWHCCRKECEKLRIFRLIPEKTPASYRSRFRYSPADRAWLG